MIEANLDPVVKPLQILDSKRAPRGNRLSRISRPRHPIRSVAAEAQY
jgi:hypothetical protein